MFAQDLDDVFAYQTPKVVKIRDRYLGFLRISLLALIFIFIVVFQILYKGTHLSVEDIQGTYRLQLQHPTLNGCNPKHSTCSHSFRPLTDIPYCDQSDLEYINDKKPCQYFDATDVEQFVGDGILVPTNIETVHQRRACIPSNANDWTCEGQLYNNVGEDGHFLGTHGAEDVTYVADIGRFTILIDHSFQGMGKAEDMQFDQSDLSGSWLRCSGNSCEKVPIVCGMSNASRCKTGEPTLEDFEARKAFYLRAGKGGRGASDHTMLLDRGVGRKVTLSQDTAPAMSAAALRPTHDRTLRRSSFLRHSDASRHRVVGLIGVGDVDSHGGLEEARAQHYAMDAPQGMFESPVISITHGDVFSIDQLLRMAGVDLDEMIPTESGSTSNTYRRTGLVLLVLIEYTNDVTWCGLKASPWHQVATPEYTIRVKSAPAYRFKMRSVERSSLDADTRTFLEYNGIRIVVHQHGRLLVWSWTTLLVILTTSLGLLKVADLITEMLALYALPKAKAFNDLKYEKSIDFNP
eukprot:TRINITY_DN12539_c0_g5_i1.p1 TRINITY_DN12539_c0_g5~~TRINITY_DN12539_c0_g5_i1.p1  ORF type:complete len:519 (-),score=63.36 TRINITY_DN12539_c0_g5_i1:94-1650(-)